MKTRIHVHPTPAESSPKPSTTIPSVPTVPEATKPVVPFGDKSLNGRPVAADDVRLCAYQKWEKAGKPTGDGLQFWLEAEQELGKGK